MTSVNFSMLTSSGNATVLAHFSSPYHSSLLACSVSFRALNQFSQFSFSQCYFFIFYIFFLFLFRYSARLVYLFPLPVAVEAVFVAIILSVPSITNLHPLTTLFHIAMMSMSLLMMLHVSQCSDVC